MRYYICDACKFQFVRCGEVTQCPDCGKEAVRIATEEEIIDFERIKQELKWK